MESGLGISLGTRQLGIALMRNSDLIDWHVRSFPAQWSKNKLKKIVLEIEVLIDDHDVKNIAVKIPGILPTSKGFIQLMGALNVLCEAKGIKAQYYTLKDLQQYFSPEKKVSKDTLAALLALKHSELLTIYNKGKQRRDMYYGKIFEAVAVVSMMERTSN
jgi:hypothetical protein